MSSSVELLRPGEDDFESEAAVVRTVSNMKPHYDKDDFKFGQTLQRVKGREGWRALLSSLPICPLVSIRSHLSSIWVDRLMVSRGGALVLVE